MYIITIDGPSASGKSTVADIVAKKLSIEHINSGEAYRAIAYFMLQQSISPKDEEAVNKALKQNKFEMICKNANQILKVNDKDVTRFLHTNQINEVVSQYGKNPQVIYKASDMAREACKNISAVMDGRNLGSFCFPDAKYKFYVDCDAYERADRRFNEMKQKGIDVDFDSIYQQTLERDNLDKTRNVAPLIVPENAIVIDSTHLTAEQVAEKIVDIVNKLEKHTETNVF